MLVKQQSSSATKMSESKAYQQVHRQLKSTLYHLARKQSKVFSHGKTVNSDLVDIAKRILQKVDDRYQALCSDDDKYPADSSPQIKRLTEILKYVDDGIKNPEGLSADKYNKLWIHWPTEHKAWKVLYALILAFFVAATLVSAVILAALHLPSLAVLAPLTADITQNLAITLIGAGVAISALSVASLCIINENGIRNICQNFWIVASKNNPGIAQPGGSEAISSPTSEASESSKLLISPAASL